VPHNRPPSQGFGCANSRRGTLPRHRECAGWEEATEAKTHSEGISGLAVAGADRAGRKPQPASASSPSLRTLGLHCCTLLRINPSCAGRPTMGILARTKGQPARTRTGRHCRRHKAMPDSDQIGNNATFLKPPEFGEGAEEGGPQGAVLPLTIQIAIAIGRRGRVAACRKHTPRRAHPGGVDWNA
jgi:hypothetical protein